MHLIGLKKTRLGIKILCIKLTMQFLTQIPNSRKIPKQFGLAVGN